MNTRTSLRTLASLSFIAALITLAGTAAAEPSLTGFTYQGQLSSGGSPIEGRYDMQFRLYNAAAGGAQLGQTLCADNVEAVRGNFTVKLDFGAQFTDQARYLEISVRSDRGLGCSNGDGYSRLTPRQEVSATPNALFAMGASTAKFADAAAVAEKATLATSALDSQRVGGQPVSNIALLNGNQTFSGVVRFGNTANTFTGNGSTITNLNARNISTGVLDAARMPTNWAAGGDLTGFFPSPTIGPGAVTMSKLSPGVQSELSKFSRLTPAPTPLDGVGWGSNLNGQVDFPALPAGVTYVAVSSGSTHNIALRSDGSVAVWGANQLGLFDVPALPSNITYTAVAAGTYHNLALRSDGMVAAWGWNADGQTDVPALPSGVTYTAVAGGGSHSLALRSDGMVAAWGRSAEGQLNVPALPFGVRYTAVAGGGSCSLALRSDGTVVAWGTNGAGQLNVPALPSGVTYTSVAAGGQHCLALRSDGMVAAWGTNGVGELNVPALPSGVTYTAVAAGPAHSLALRSDGMLTAWGYNALGQTNVPPLPAGVAYTAMAGGYLHSIALRGTRVTPSLGSSVGLSIGSTTPPPAVGGISVAGASSFAGRVSASSFSGSGADLTNLSARNISTGVLDVARMPTNWAAGGDLTGFFPNPTISAGAVTRSTLSPDLRSELSRASSVSSTLSSLTPAPTPLDAVGWGWNESGQTDVPTLPAGVTYVAASAGYAYNAALRSDGNVVAWGQNNHGQTNVVALPPALTYTAVAAGEAHTLALRSDGMVIAWGYNESDQTNVPTLPTGVTYTAVAAGTSHSLGLRSDGTVVAWGESTNGQLNVPPLPSGVTYTAVAAGGYHSVALRSDGTVAAWGNNLSGQINVPTLPPGVTYTAVAAGAFYTLALRSDGMVAAWGNNANAQINVPTLPAGVTYTAVAAGSGHSLALRSDGALIAWGWNQFGQTDVPALPAGVAYAAVAGGYGHTLALRGTRVTPSLGSSVGLSIGSTTPPPAAGGISVAGASSFAGRLSAQAFSGSGTELTNLNAAQLTGTIPSSALPDTVARKDLSNIFSASANTFAGNVGIGTNSPQDRLSIQGGALSFASPDNSQPYVGFDYDTGLDALRIRRNTNGQSLDTNALVVQRTTGRVGVGTDSPQAALDVVGGVNASGTVSAAGFVGSGAGLTNLPAENVTGTLPASRLASNVALLDRNQTFSGVLNFNNPANTYVGVYSGDGSGITSLQGSNIAAGTIGRSRVAPDIESVLSQWTPAPGLPSQATPSDSVVIGYSGYGQTNVPALPAGVSYVAISMSDFHCLGLRSNGTLIGWGRSADGETTPPTLPAGVTYTAAIARGFFSLALRSDGAIIGFGNNDQGQLNIPALPAGVRYTGVSAAGSPPGVPSWAIAVRSDGSIVVWGAPNASVQNIPALPSGVTYVAVSAGYQHALALRSDGTVVAWGRSNEGQLSVPALPAGLTYVSVSAGGLHSTALRSDGQAVAWGWDVYGQSTVPPLPAGITYTNVQTAAGCTVYLRSDGSALGTGENQWSQAAIPAAPAGKTYIGIGSGHYHTALLRGDVPPVLAATSGIAIGSTVKPPTGGLSVAGAATFGSGVSAATFAGSGSGLTGLNASNITTGTLGSSALSGTYSNTLNLSNAGNTIAGNGAGLTSLNASNITTGTLPEAQLPASVARTNTANAFGALANTFAGSVGIGTTSPSRVLDVVSYLSQGTAAAVDQQQTVSNGGFSLASDMWQSFTPAVTGQLTQVDLNGASGITGQSRAVTIRIYAGEGTGGALLATSTMTLLDVGAGAWSSSTIPGQTVVVSGQLYTIRVTGAGGNFPISGATGNLYTRGRNDADATKDYMFKTYVAAAASRTMFNVGLGGVGIGTNTPTSLLSVAGTADFAGAVSAASFAGSGAALTSLSASNVSAGTLADARLSSNVPLKNAGSNAFTGSLTAASFGGSGSGLTGLNASNLSGGTVADSLLSGNIPRLNTNNVFQSTTQFVGRVGINTPAGGPELNVNGRMNVAQGVIQRGGVALTDVSDLGLYSQVSGSWIRFVTTGGAFLWFSDSGIGTNAVMDLGANGNLTIRGSLAKGGGSFKIDHPLDPENKYLYHSFVESPDMMNVYNGVVTLDELGQATVELPDYFEALNRDFRYQLTCIGGFAPVYISQKVHGNSFAIAGGSSGLEVSWQVTGIRHDAWAEKNRIPNAVDKVGGEKGKYLHPDAFGKPAAMGIPVPNQKPTSHE